MKNQKWLWFLAAPFVAAVSSGTPQGYVDPYWPAKTGKGYRTVTVMIPKKSKLAGWCYDIGKSGLYIQAGGGEGEDAVLVGVKQICVEKRP